MNFEKIENYSEPVIFEMDEEEEPPPTRLQIKDVKDIYKTTRHVFNEMQHEFKKDQRAYLIRRLKYKERIRQMITNIVFSCNSYWLSQGIEKTLSLPNFTKFDYENDVKSFLDVLYNL